jgi:hypothetical protein
MKLVPRETHELLSAVMTDDSSPKPFPFRRPDESQEDAADRIGEELKQAAEVRAPAEPDLDPPE